MLSKIDDVTKNKGALMKRHLNLKTIISNLGLAGMLLAATVVSAAPVVASTEATPPAANKQLVSGPEAKPPVEPGSQDAKALPSLGATNLVETDENGKQKTATPLVGAVAGVDFQTNLKYCWRNLLYTPVKNTTATSKSIHVRVYNQGNYRDLYTSVAAGATVSPAFYGINGAYTAYLYVWNGTTYQYDELVSGTLTCNVSVTRVYNASGWVQLKIQNLGTAFATQVSSELAPYPASGTYTGTHYGYPAPGGAAIYRWFNVGSQPYAIVSRTDGSFNSPIFFTGDL